MCLNNIGYHGIRVAMWYGISNTGGLGTLKKNMARIVLKMGLHLTWPKLDGVGEGGRKNMFFQLLIRSSIP